MDRRTAGAALHAAVLLACVVALAGHLCVSFHAARADTLVGPSMVGASGEASPAAPCEALPGSPVTCAGSLAVETRLPTSGLRVAETGDALDTPAPIPRPPRFLLHAALLS